MTPAKILPIREAGAEETRLLEQQLGLLRTLIVERQRWMRLHAQAVAELRACQSLLAASGAQSTDVAMALEFTGGNIGDVLDGNTGEPMSLDIDRADAPDAPDAPPNVELSGSDDDH